MSLTGRALVVLVVLLAVAVLAGAVLLWPRLAPARPLAVLARAGTLAATNLAVLLVVAVVLNDQFGFFADWTDLGGAVGGTAVRTATGGGATSALFPTTALPAAPARTLPPLPPGQGPGGRLLSYSVTGTRSGVTGQVLVDLPAGYRADPHRAWPVIEAFSGYPGSPGQWIGAMHLPEYLDAAVAARTVGPAIVVSPEIEVPPGADSECVDAGPGRQVETWVARDVPDWVAHHFRTIPDRRAWATIGLSAGGWCSAMATMLHPQQYGGAVVMGGYWRPAFTGTPLLAPGSPQADRYDLVALARTAPPPVALWVETSHADHVSYRTSQVMLAAARAPLSLSAVVLTHAGHRLSVWRDLTPRALAWLGRTLPGFAPTYVGRAA